MGDVADILGLGGGGNATNKPNEMTALMSDKVKGPGSTSKAKKPKGMSREVFGLLGPDSLTSTVQSTSSISVSSSFQKKRVSALKGKWVWAPFTAVQSSVATTASTTTSENSTEMVVNSSTGSVGPTDQYLYHWVRAEVQYTEYPYAKFNVELDRVAYSEDEYDKLLQSSTWTKSETDELMSLCYKYDLRWPVIVDRYGLYPPRTLEDCQQRFYNILAILKGHRIDSVTSMSSLPSSNKSGEPISVYNIESERARRYQLEMQFRRTKEEEEEETRLREELKQLDASIKKMKKIGKQSSSSSSAAASGGASAIESNSGNKLQDNDLGINILQAPTRGKPMLQSARLFGLNAAESSNLTPQLSKTLVRKMYVLLRELGSPDVLMPTRAVCDLYDQVRRDAITLLSLHSGIHKKEKELAALAPAGATHDLALPHNSLLLTKFPPPSTVPIVIAPPPPVDATATKATTSSTSSSSKAQSSKSGGEKSGSSSKSSSNKSAQAQAAGADGSSNPTGGGATTTSGSSKKKRKAPEPPAPAADAGVPTIKVEDETASAASNANPAPEIAPPDTTGTSAQDSAPTSSVAPADSSAVTAPQSPSAVSPAGESAATPAAGGSARNAKRMKK